MEKIDLIIEKYFVKEKLFDEIDRIQDEGGIEGIAQKLSTDIENGLSHNEAKKRLNLNTDKENEIKEKIFFSKKFLDKFKQEIKNSCLLLSCLGLYIVSSLLISSKNKSDKLFGKYFFLIFHSTAITESITLPLIIILYISNETRKQLNSSKKILNLKKKQKKSEKYTVIREGSETVEKSINIQSGDILILKPGMKILFDGLLISDFRLKTDESAMTGESELYTKLPLKKCEEKKLELISEGKEEKISPYGFPSPVLISGSYVVEGEGKMLVVKSKEDSLMTKAMMLQDSEEMINDEISSGILNKIFENIEEKIKARIVMVVIVMGVLFIFMKIFKFKMLKEKFGFFAFFFRSIIYIILTSFLFSGKDITSFLSGKRIMIIEKISKNLKFNSFQNFETLAFTNTLCCEYSGLIIEDVKSITGFWNFGFYDLETENKNFLGIQNLISNQNLYRIIKLCLIAGIGEGNGNGFNQAMKKYFLKFFNEEKKTEIIEKNFNLSYSKTIEDTEEEGYYFLKGNSGKIMEKCDKIIDLTTGDVKELSEREKNQIMEEVENLTSPDLQKIALSYKLIEDGNYTESGYTLLGFIFTKYLVKENSKFILQNIETSGIETIITTHLPYSNIIKNLRKIGLRSILPVNKKTSEEIFEEVELEFGHIKEIKKFESATKNLKILTNSLSKHKELLVIGLKQSGKKVASTGSGAGDASILRLADIGLCLNQNSTEIAQNSASISSPFNDLGVFITMVRGARELAMFGRVYSETYQLNSILITCGLLFGGLITGKYILSLFQIFWVRKIFWLIFQIYFLMNFVSGFLLKWAQYTGELLEKGPFSQEDFENSRKSNLRLYANLIFQIMILVGVFSSGDQMFPNCLNCNNPDFYVAPTTLNNYYFNIFSFIVLTNVFNKIFFRNKTDLFKISTDKFGIALLIFFLQLIIGGFGGYLTGISTEGIGYRGWVVCATLSLICVAWNSIVVCVTGEGGDYEEFDDELSVILNTQTDVGSNRMISSIRVGKDKN